MRQKKIKDIFIFDIKTIEILMCSFPTVFSAIFQEISCFSTPKNCFNFATMNSYIMLQPFRELVFLFINGIIWTSAWMVIRMCNIAWILRMIEHFPGLLSKESTRLEWTWWNLTPYLIKVSRRGHSIYHGNVFVCINHLVFWKELIMEDALYNINI